MSYILNTNLKMFVSYPYNTFLSKLTARYISTALNVNAKNHYDILGINSKSTQAEIKAAYYKLSKVYHPDKNQGSSDAATKFRDITAAYEILGNVRMRKLYDKGVHVDEPVYRHPAEDDDPRTRFYRSRERRHRPPMSGRTPIYDFDEWSRAHYGATFARDMERKRKEQFRKDMATQNQNDVKIEKVVYALMIFIGIFYYFSGNPYDVDKTYYDSTKKTKPSQ